MTIEKHVLAVPRWARGGHRQTLLGHFLGLAERPPPLGELLVIDLPDGDQLAARCNAGTSDTVVYLFHGLSGDIASGYMHRTAKLLLGRGHTVVRVNHRGCGVDGVALRHAHPYHSGRGEDLCAVLEFGKTKFPKRKHVAIGFSLSANALLVLLAGVRGRTLPDAAIAVNAPIELAEASRLLSQGLNRIYDLNFTSQLRNDVIRRQKKGWVPPSLDLPRFLSCRDFDALYTGPFGGFGSREKYYTTCSALPHLERIQTPTTLIMAEDDPFVSARHYYEARLSPKTRLWITDTGGHMGYLTWEPDSLIPRSWLDQALLKALES